MYKFLLILTLPPPPRFFKNKITVREIKLEKWKEEIEMKHVCRKNAKKSIWQNSHRFQCTKHRVSKMITVSSRCPERFTDNLGIILEETRNTSGTEEVARSIAKMIAVMIHCEHAATVEFITAITRSGSMYFTSIVDTPRRKHSSL